MGEFANALWLRIVGWITVWIIIILNTKLLFDSIAPLSVQQFVYGHLGLPTPN